VPEPVCSICGGHPSLSHVGPGITISPDPGGSGLNSEKRIYTTVAKDRLVEEGDPEAAFLVAGEGGEVPAEYVHLYREYRKAHEAEPKAAAKAPADDALEEKAVEKAPENKARATAEKK
jgi:hypothetical protein